MTKTGKPYSGQEQDHVPVQLHQCLRASRDSVCIREKVLTRHEDSAGKLRLASAFSAKYMTRHEYFGLQMRVASQTSLADQTASGLKHIVLQLTRSGGHGPSLYYTHDDKSR